MGNIGGAPGVSDTSITILSPTQNQNYSFTYSNFKTFAQATLLTGHTWSEVANVVLCVTNGFESGTGAQFYVDNVSLT